MKRAAFLLIVLVLALGALGPGTALAQPSAAGATWSSDIIYFYPPPTPPDPATLLTPINKNLTLAFSSVAADGSVKTIPYPVHTIGYDYFSETILAGSIGQNFSGSAVVSAEVPVVAVYKQVSSTSNPYSPILYTSFSAAQAGNGIFYLPSVRRNPAFVSQIGIQNVDSVPEDLTLNFYAVGSSTPAFTPPTITVQSQNSYVFKLSDLKNFPMTFDGSLVINAVHSGTSDLGTVIAVVQEVQGNGRQAYAYEGAKSGASTIYMPSAMCNVGKTQQTTYYAIQNVDTNPGAATISYYDGLGNPVVNMTTPSIPPNSKVSVSTCGDPNSPTYAQFKAAVAGKTIMSAVITGTSLVAMGKVQSTDGLMTAFLGLNLATIGKQADGNYHVALPYVEWSNSTLGFRSYIAVMNASGAPETNITVNYWRRNGENAPIHSQVILAKPTAPLAANAKRNTEPDQVVPTALDRSKSFIGAAEVISDQPVVVVVRVQRGVSGIPGVTTLGEDYSGIDVLPPTP